MKKAFYRYLILPILVLSAALAAYSQTSGTISGTVLDEQGARLPSAVVSVRRLDTNATRTVAVDRRSRYRFRNLPIGKYEITVRAPGFAKYVQSGITLVLNQDAVVDVLMTTASVSEVVTKTADASLLGTTNAEIGVRFDPKSIADLPIATTRNVYNLAISVPGVSQLGAGQSGFAQSMNYSANGGRLRSNNFILDGQDINDPSVTGAQQPLSIPDLIQEVRVITNQFDAEYGRNSGSVFNIITKSGTNQFHGSGFWLHNDNHLNSRTNLDKNIGLSKAPFRLENQMGVTAGGPVHLPGLYRGTDKTFFFGSVQYWTDRRVGSGTTLNGAPTAEGREVLQSVAGNRPQVAALLRFVPAAQRPNGTSETFDLGGRKFTVPLGDLTGSSPIKEDDWQWSARIDHDLNDSQRLGFRYIFDDRIAIGSENAQVTPPGLISVVTARPQSATAWLTSLPASRWVNDLRVSWSRFATISTARDATSEEIPSIEIVSLGMNGFNAGAFRTAFGLAVNQPQFRFNNTYQLRDQASYSRGNHALKFGGEIERVQVKSFVVSNVRGRLQYTTLDNFVKDIAQAASINLPLPGGQAIQYYDNYDYRLFAQDEWRVAPRLSLSLGLRYELPGNTFDDLVPINDRIVTAAGGDERYRFTPVPRADRNNLQPRVGFSWNPRFTKGVLGIITGGEKLVLRGGAARTNDAAFINLNLNIAAAFPFIAAINLPRVDAFANIKTAKVTGLNPSFLTRTIVDSQFRTPTYDQFSLEIQRELSRDLIMSIGYVGTRGTGLLQTIDGNPRVLSTTPADPSKPRVDPTRGVIRLRANAASSTYHSLQISLDKRLNRNLSAGVHYTWSALIDTASEVFNASGSEVAIAQDSFNRRADRARSAYDRPHRLAGNVVYELPYFISQRGVIGHLLGGFQVNALFSFQSGAPFTVFNGSDPTGALSGIDGLVGSAIRPNINTNLDLSSMSIPEILAAGGASLFRPLGPGERVGNAGRNILRTDGINNVDLGIQKNIRVREGHLLQLKADMYDFTNTRDFSIPVSGAINSGAAFLNQWSTLASSRRIFLGLRYQF